MGGAGNMQSYVNNRLRVKLDDGRDMLGTLLAFDRHTNMVLADAEQHRYVKGTPPKTERRALGLVLLRGESVVSISVEAPPPALRGSRLEKARKAAKKPGQGVVRVRRLGASSCRGADASALLGASALRRCSAAPNGPATPTGSASNAPRPAHLRRKISRMPHAPPSCRPQRPPNAAGTRDGSRAAGGAGRRGPGSAGTGRHDAAGRHGVPAGDGGAAARLPPAAMRPRGRRQGVAFVTKIQFPRFYLQRRDAPGAFM